MWTVPSFFFSKILATLSGTIFSGSKNCASDLLREKKTVQKLEQKVSAMETEMELPCSVSDSAWKKKKKKNSERVNFFERALTGCFMTLIKALRFFLPPLPSLSEERPTEQVNRLVCTIYSYNRLYNVPRSFCYLTGGFLWGS